MNTAASPTGAEQFGRFAFFAAERRLHVDGQPVALGSRAFDLLAALIARRDRVVPKNELIEVVWPGLVVEDNNLQVQISALRKVLGTQAIATVPGRGYQFTVAAAAPPGIAPGTAPAPRAALQAGAAPSRASRLLVADDNKVNRLLLCRSLELMGHEVASADNGHTALERLRGERFDLLLLDLEMPEMDGFSLLEQRAADPALRELPVIVTSSLEGVAQVARCIELGADDYLHKPVNPVLLKARVDSSLERKHLRDRERELLARLAPGLADGLRVAGATSAGRRTVATLLAARLRDVDALVQAQSAQETLELLGNWSTLMLDAIESHGGRVTQLAGDAIAAVFEAADTALSALQTTQEMLELTAQFNRERTSAGELPIALGVGIASGEIVAGHAGTPRRASFVCVGAAAQHAAALAVEATQRGDAVLIDGSTHAALADHLSSLEKSPNATATPTGAFSIFSGR
jgi:DNA-binding response OmpR family regulator